MQDKRLSEIGMIAGVYIGLSYLLEIFFLIMIAIAFMPSTGANLQYLTFKDYSGEIIFFTIISTLIFYATGTGLQNLKRWALHFSLIGPNLIGIALLYLSIKYGSGFNSYSVTVILFLAFLALTSWYLTRSEIKKMFR